MRILVQNDWRNKAIFGLIIFMLGSLFVSRAMLSVGVILFIATTILHAEWQHQLRVFARTPVLSGIAVLFLIPFISGLWSADLKEWAEVMIIKLPFFLLPLAFAGKWQLRQEQNRRIAQCFVTFTVLACIWSLIRYFMNMDAIHESYLQAKTIPTLLGDDHVRFSWIVFIAIWVSVFLIENTGGTCRIILLSAITLLVIFLHLLAARAGLAMFYLSAFGYVLYKLKKKPGQMLLLTGGLVALLLIGWFCFPTFKNRIRYNLYDLSFILKDKYRSGTSDGNRVASLRAGWAVLKEHPFTGAGAGDVWRDTGRWYDKQVNGIQDSDRLYPSNEWLAHGCIAGWPGLILFSIVILLPLYIRNIRQRFFWIGFHLSAVCLFLVETSLEMQHGIFIYTFFVLWWWKWHCFEENYSANC